MSQAQQLLSALDLEIQELNQFQRQYISLPPIEQQRGQAKINGHKDRIKQLRISALREIQPGDAHSLTRAIGVVHAYPIFMELGIGSIQALTSCTKKQFQRVARPPQLGWTSGTNDIPPQTDEQTIQDVSAVLQSLGLRWRDPKEQPKVKLPEPVLSKQFNPGFDPKERFKEDSFDGYAKPAYVRGVPGKLKPLVEELKVRGIYSWDDLTKRTGPDLIRTGLHRTQVFIAQYNLRLRGHYMLMEKPPTLVYQDMFDVDKVEAREFVNKETGQTERTEGMNLEELVAQAEEGRVQIKAEVVKTVLGAQFVGTVIKETDSEIHLKNEKEAVFVIPKRDIVERKKGNKVVTVIDVADTIKDRIDMVDSDTAEEVGEGVYVASDEKEMVVAPSQEPVEFPQTPVQTMIPDPPKVSFPAEAPPEQPVQPEQTATQPETPVAFPAAGPS